MFIYSPFYYVFSDVASEESLPLSPGQSPPSMDVEEVPAGIPGPSSGRKRKAQGAAEPGKRKRYSCWSFTDEQEQELVEWLQANTFLWLRSTKDYHRKKAAWEAKARDLGVSLKHLQNWWKNVKDWYVKLQKKTSGQATRVLTDRDKWILKNVAFYKSKYMSIAYIFTSYMPILFSVFFMTRIVLSRR